MPGDEKYSQSSGALIRVGLITKVRGVRGELLVKPLTDDPKRFRQLTDVFIEKPDCNPRREYIENVLFHKGQVAVKFDGCDDADAAQAFRGSYIAITAEQLVPLEKDSYFVFDLIGCAVFDIGGERLGELIDVLETGSNDVYVVKPYAGMGSSGAKPDTGTGGGGGAKPDAGAGGGSVKPGAGARGGSQKGQDAGIKGGCSTSKGKDILIPALKTVVREVDIGNKRIVIDYKQQSY